MVDGEKHWIVGKDVDLGKVHASGVVHRDGRKSRGLEFFALGHEDVHVESIDMQKRLTLLDRLGIHAQIMYPDLAGFAEGAPIRVE